MARLIVLEGWPAAGKSTLWALLAGHKDVFVEPIHTYFYEAAFHLGLDESPKTFTVREIRSSLSKTEYYKTEQYALAGELPVHFGADRTERKCFTFDWYEFDKLFISEVAGKELTFSLFIDKYLLCYQKGLGRIEREYTYFLTMSNYYNAKVTALKSEQLNFRVLIAYRSYKDIIASRIQRKPRKEDGKKSNEFAPSFYALLRSGEVEKITEFYRTYRWCKEALLIDIQELITSKDRELREITFWLGLDELKRPYIDYFLGEILSRKYSFSNAINDEVKFSSLEKLTLHTHRCLSILFPFGAFVLNLKSVLAVFYKRWIQAKMNVK